MNPAVNPDVNPIVGPAVLAGGTAPAAEAAPESAGVGAAPGLRTPSEPDDAGTVPAGGPGTSCADAAGTGRCDAGRSPDAGSPSPDPAATVQPTPFRGVPSPQAGAVQDEALARATWSRLAEPADPAACALVGALGARRALAWLLEAALDADARVRDTPPAPPIPPPLGSELGRVRAAWARAASRWAPRLAELDIRRELDVLERLGGSLVLPGDPWWPPELDELDLPPHCLWVRGDPALLAAGTPAGLGDDGDTATPGVGTSHRSRRDLVRSGPAAGLALALVGARACTDYGCEVASAIASDLTAAGAVVVSGGAYGIDAAAHRGALLSGPTLAVGAGGVDRLYPAGNADLLRAVVDSGALVAEVPPGCQPARHRFLTRNRIIAALGGATVVVEAAWRSGALSTAHHARDLGRPLGAVPGPVTSMESVGCHRLLREGAVCVTDAADALELLVPLGSVDPEAARAADPDNAGDGLLDGLDGNASVVVDALPARGAATTEALARAAGLSEAEVVAALGLLELSGRVRRDGTRWRRAPRQDG